MEYEQRVREITEGLFRHLKLPTYGSQIMDLQTAIGQIIEDEKTKSEAEGESNGADNDDCNCGCTMCESCEWK